MTATSRANIAEGVRAIDRAYGETARQVQGGVNNTKASFGEAARLVGGTYDEMTRALQGQADATASGLGSQLSMLGIGAAQDAATQNLRGQLNQSLISAARRRATGVSGLQFQGAAYKQAGDEAVGNIRREGRQAATDSRTQLMTALLGLEQAEAEAKGQMELQKLQGEIELEQMRQQMRAAAARARGGGGGRSGSPLDLLRAQLMGLEIQEKMQALQMGPDTSFGSGQGQLNQFLGNSSDYWENQAGPKFRAGLEDILDYSFAQANNPASIAAGMDDPYNIAMGNLNRGGRGLNQDALRQALQIYFG
jgi:hypothetical protein